MPAPGRRIDVVLVVGGKYHDFDYARLELLKLLFEHEDGNPDGRGPIALMPGTAPVQFANVYVRRIP